VNAYECIVHSTGMRLRVTLPYALCSQLQHTFLPLQRGSQAAVDARNKQGLVINFCAHSAESLTPDRGQAVGTLSRSCKNALGCHANVPPGTITLPTTPHNSQPPKASECTNADAAGCNSIQTDNSSLDSLPKRRCQRIQP
jgi:hypothetical protein